MDVLMLELQNNGNFGYLFHYCYTITLAVVTGFVLIFCRHNRLMNKLKEKLREQIVLKKSQSPETDFYQNYERLQLLMDATNDGMWDWDIKNNTLFWSDKLFTLLGLSPGSCHPNLELFYQLLHEEDRVKVTQAIQQHLLFNQPYKCEMQLKKADGSYGWFLGQGKAVKDVNGHAIRMVGSMVDISDRKQIEEKLQQSEQKFRSIFDNVSVGMALVNAEGYIILANEADCHFLGYTQEELLGMHFTEFTHPEDLAIDVELYKSLLAGERSSYVIDKRYIRKDQAVVWGRLTVSLIRDQDGSLLYTVIVCEDITVRKQAEEALRQSEARLAAAQRVARIGNWELDVVTKKIVGSEELFRIFGFSDDRKEYDYQEFFQISFPDDRERLIQAISKGINQGKSFKIDFKAVRKDNVIIYNQAKGEAVFNSQGRIVKLFGTVQDITERKQLEELLQSQLQKEEALNRVIQIIRNSLDLSTIFSSAVIDIGELLEVEQVAIFQYLPENEVWLAVAEYRQNSNINSLMKQKIPDRENPIASQLKKLKIVQLNDASLSQDEINHSLAQTFPGAWLLIPLHFNSATWGCLSLLKPQQYSWQESEIEIAREIAEQLAMAIYQSELYHQVQVANEELKRLATIDGLTQIANRRRFDEYLNLEWLRLRREKAPLCLILFDIDYFKLYNDTYGHLAGDDCLRQVAIAISEIFRRPGDLFCRYGGEEFAVVLPYTHLSGATYLAELIRQAIHNLQIPHSQSLVSNHLTISLGVACIIPNAQFSPQNLINVADQALYTAKQQGRDRVVFSEINYASFCAP
ncbi:PAS domain S-box protein [Phormidium sp. LEGE 05292]|uniref:PAS domain-containing protein n=1 Tax=[Phormidium] sp. LEGE 05292 TaxID=767427 RepID=UPI001880B82F|nr:PAS domain-containing protein [Phormidium sp. LEGE 05292]MBE9227231.1 PAS domain S-box protein [Phormidium sp. LEGE 05292]